MNPQSYRQLLVSLTSGLGKDVQIETVLAIGSLVSVAPLRSIEARIVDGLIAWMTEFVAETDTLPRLDWLWFFPAQIANRCCCIGNATVFIIRRGSTVTLWSDAGNTGNLTSLDSKDRTLATLFTGRATH
jgi:hypothetical protein